MSAFFGWKAVDADGRAHFFSGAKPEGAFVSVEAVESEFVFDHLVQAARGAYGSLDWERKHKVRLIDNAAAARIASGFRSSATGAEMHYKSGVSDIAHLTADMALAGVGEDEHPVLCSPDGAQWSFASHSSALLGVILRDYRAHRLACHARADELKASVGAAETVDAVRAVPQA